MMTFLYHLLHTRCWHYLIVVLSATVGCLKSSIQTNVSEVAGNISEKSFCSTTCWWYADTDDTRLLL